MTFIRYLYLWVNFLAVVDRGQDSDRGRGALNFAGAGAGGSILKCSQKFKPKFDSNLENCRNA